MILKKYRLEEKGNIPSDISHFLLLILSYGFSSKKVKMLMGMVCLCSHACVCLDAMLFTYLNDCYLYVIFCLFRYNLLRGCPNAKTVTLILRGGAEQFIEETERSLHDAIMIVRRALKVCSCPVNKFKCVFILLYYTVKNSFLPPLSFHHYSLSHTRTRTMGEFGGSVWH